MTLVPHGVVIVAWWAVRRSLGYGVIASGVYLDPLREPGLYLQAFPQRFFAASFSLAGGPWSEGFTAYSFFMPGLDTILLVAAVIATGVVAYVLVPMWRTYATVRFMLTGALLSLVPSSAAFPADRTLLFTAVGTMGAFAELMAVFVQDRAVFASSRARALLTWATVHGFFVVHLVLAPLLLPMRARGIADVRGTLDRAYDTVPSGPELKDQVLVYVNPPADPFVSYLPIYRAARGIPHARSQRWLATATTELLVERLDDQTLRVTADRGFMLSTSERLLRSPDNPLAVGDVVETPEMQVRIAETVDGRPKTIEARFHVPLEDPSLRWLVWRTVGSSTT